MIRACRRWGPPGAVVLLALVPAVAAAAPGLTVTTSSAQQICAMNAGSPVPGAVPCDPDKYEEIGGVRLDPGSSMNPIDKHGVCRFVDNQGSEALFIPIRSDGEWAAFLARAQQTPTLVVQTCARQMIVTIHAERDSQTQTDTLPYARTGSTVTRTYSFKAEVPCPHDSATTCTRTEDHTVTFLAGQSADGEKAAPGWQWAAYRTNILGEEIWGLCGRNSPPTLLHPTGTVRTLRAESRCRNGSYALYTQTIETEISCAAAGAVPTTNQRLSEPAFSRCTRDVLAASG